MTDYYSILGISKTADDLEIKTAFRKLAKIYHPDKNPDNPDAKQLFQTILKAYNTLIHPSARRRYDIREAGINSNPAKTQHTKRKTQKEWTFTEEEMQRRQYYEKHYKAKQKEKATHPQPLVKVHSDYKYILFATPVAIALLMFVLSMFTNSPPTLLKNNKNSVSTPIKPVALTLMSDSNEIMNGSKPYTGYFGGIKTFITSHALHITNTSLYDAIVVVVDHRNNDYLQHAYISPDFSVEFSKLPDNVYLKCMIGKYWNKEKFLKNETVQSGFDSIVQYQDTKKNSFVFDNEETLYYKLNIINPKSNEKKFISTEIDFFKKP